MNPARSIVLDAAGRVVSVNGHWQNATDGRFPHAVVQDQADYGDACEAMHEGIGARAVKLATGVRQVLSDERSTFFFEYDYVQEGATYRVHLDISKFEAGPFCGVMVLCHGVGNPSTWQPDAAPDRDEFHATLFERNALPMWVYDPQTLCILAVNDAAVDGYGYERTHFLSLTIADIRPADDRAALRADVLESRHKTVDKSRKLWRHRTRDGTLIDVEIHAHQVRWNGRDARMVTAQDVTVRQAAMRALQESETRFRQITECISEVFWLIEGDRLLYVSPGYEAIWGLSADALQRGVHQWRDSIHPEDVDRVTRALALQYLGNYDIEYRIVRPDSRVVWIADRAFPVVGVADQPQRSRRIVGVARDITERKLVEQQLQQSQRLESVGQLTGGIAHDFNNLLTVILGNSDVLVEQLAASSSHQRLAIMIGNAAQRGADLVQRLLAFARKQALEPRVVALEGLLAGLEEILHRTLGERIEVSRVCADALWPALVDPTQLESALLNLALNARDAMPSGGRLSLSAANVEIAPGLTDDHIDPGDYVLLKVSDSGTGMAPEQLARVFEPFYTTKGRGKGTGLGLAMVYGFVMQSNGHVAIDSRLGEGTSVQIYLPRHRGGALQSAPDDDEQTPIGSHQLVLLVEDDDMVRLFARHVLESLSYRVVEATNADEALAILEGSNSVDLLFTDVVMPGRLTGADLGRRARALNPTLPILYASGYTDSALDSGGTLEPGVLLLGKPYRRTDLARKLRQAFVNATVLISATPTS